MQVHADRGPLHHVLRDATLGPVDVDFQYLRQRTLGFAEEERVGGGAFGDVFRGVEPRSGDFFAVKRISRLLLGVVTIAAAGAIPLLIALLRDGTAKGKENAASALWNLAANNADNDATIIAAGAISLLIALLREGTVEGKTNAAGALWNLAANADN
ncbi:hypothetical protein B484DRAFT_396896 [Ochromonadaceae sp. CCMP2298]|nr:hypothetical protein B484DRAFT_396896 [Ochromonadaceae sp. CCMP2298]